MSRILSLAALFLLACAPARAQSVAVSTRPAPGAARPSDVPWDDAAHIRYFRYQVFLTSKGLVGETREGWTRQTAAERARKAAEGEEFLRGRLAELLQKPHLSEEDNALLKAVWGEQTAAAVGRVATARRVDDPRQVELALRSVRSLVGPAAEKVDWNLLFDGTRPDAAGPPDAARVDPLAVERKPPFLESLASREVQAVLANRRTYADFLRRYNVPAQAQPAMLAMYDVITKAGPAERQELSHILPTAVHFLREGKPIVMENMEGALGFAVPGQFDTAERVGITQAGAAADPVVVADILTHEFQHVYDMYTGRYYSLDSELRGFKSEVAFYRALRTASPAKLAEMQSSDDARTRHHAGNWSLLESRLAAGPRDFCDHVAFGHGYNHYHGAVFSGRLPLREALQDRAAPAQLAARERLRDDALRGIALLEARQKQLLAVVAQSPTRANEKELQKTTEDLASARAGYNHYDQQVVIDRMRIARMQSEVAWLDRRSSSKKDPDPYDLHLQVDASYAQP